MSARLLSLLIWALVAASAAYWGLRLFTRPLAVPGGAVVALAAAPAAGDLAPLLGTPPARPVAEAAAVAADSRFRLLGVVAPRAGQVNGLALVSVDGKPARAVAVGREIEPGLRLLAVSQREADFGQTRGAPVFKLSLPMLAEANRGRLGDPAAAAMPVAAGRPGQPMQMPAMPSQQPRPLAGVAPRQGGPVIQEQTAEPPPEGATPVQQR
jgi:general secretion pathway protein C